MRVVEAVRGAFAGVGRSIKALMRVPELAEVAARLRSYMPMIVVLALDELANKILGGLTGIKQLGLAMAGAMFSIGIILAVMYFASRGLRERGKEYIEAACILCFVIGTGTLILTFAGEAGQTIAGEKAEKVEVPSPWR